MTLIGQLFSNNLLLAFSASSSLILQRKIRGGESLLWCACQAKIIRKLTSVTSVVAGGTVPPQSRLVACGKDRGRS